MTDKVIKRGRPSRFDDIWQTVVALRLKGKFVPAIAKSLGMSRFPIYSWLRKAKEDDAEKKYLLFKEKYTEADQIATMNDLDEFDENIKKMAADTPDHNKFMDTLSRVKERRNRLHGISSKIELIVKQRFTSW